MKNFAFAAILGAASAVSVADVEYMNYLAKFNKVSNDVKEFNLRRDVFTKINSLIKEHNSSDASFSLGHNQFSDWTDAEYKSILGYKRGELDVTKASTVVFDEAETPESVNWVEAGAVTPVKDQQSCGSCWAFSTTGSIQGAHFVATGELLVFSEQQLVSCAFLHWGNFGCYGGEMEIAYQYYEDDNKADLESVYPYVSGDGSMPICSYDKHSHTDVTVTEYANVTSNDIAQMKAALAKQPLAIAIEADKDVFKAYEQGVFDDVTCGTELDHAVLAVGYGTEDGKDYWLVKNSWNTTWGEQGYIKIAQVEGAGICGVQSVPLSVTTN